MATPALVKPAKVKKEKERKLSQQQPNERLKTVIRRLPPNLPEDIFWQSVQPWVSNETATWKAYYPGKLRKKLNKESIPSRAYVAFKTEELLAIFSREYDGHVFRDKNGVESQAVVEFAPYQKIPSEKKKPDNRNATIEKDEDYISFLELLKATENAEPVSLDTLLASAQVAPLPKTTPLLEALKAEKSAARDKEAILRNHAHYKQTDVASRKDEKKKGPNAALAPPLKGIDPSSSKKAAKKAHAQAQAQAQAAAAAAVQAAANPSKVSQNPKGAPKVNLSPSRPPRPSKPPRPSQPGKAIPAAASNSATTADGSGASTSTTATSATITNDSQTAPRRSRPVIGIASRQFEAALSIAGLANSASERRRREKEKDGQPATSAGANNEDNIKEDGKPASAVVIAPSLSMPVARIDGSDNEQEKEALGVKVLGLSPRKDRPRRARGGGGGGGGGHGPASETASGSTPPTKIGGILQRSDAATPTTASATTVIIQKPVTSTGSSSSVNSPAPTASSGSGPPHRGRRGRGGGRGRGGAPVGSRGGG